MIRPRISCIILTHKSYQSKGGSVEHTVLAIAQQRQISVEIVIAENSGNCRCREKLYTFLNTYDWLPDTRVVECETSIAAARNQAAAKSRGESLVFLDDDTILLTPDALAQISQYTESYSHGYGAIRLWTRPPGWFQDNADVLRDELANGKFDFLRSHTAPPSPLVRRKSDAKYVMRTFIGNFGFVRRAEFDTVGGFPEIFQKYGQEDDLLSFYLYHRYQDFVNLGKIEVAHVFHYAQAVEEGTDNQNQYIYQRALRNAGIRSFHIGDLLEMSSCQVRLVCEPLIQ